MNAVVLGHNVYKRREQEYLRMEDIWMTAARTVISFVILLVVTWMIGKHINSHKNHYSFALSVTIGSMIANMAFNIKLDYTYMLISYLTLIALFYLAMVLSFENRHIRKWISGQPTVLIENGKILEHNMRKAKYSLDDLNQLLREKDVFDIMQVEYAMLEASGELSVLKKEAYQPAIKKDFSIQSSSISLPVEVIMEGKLISGNSGGCYTEEWVLKQCRLRNIVVKDIFYAVVNSKGNLFIDRYDDQLRKHEDVD
jgi:uncharacterized membrane protein YcaP (DUF421 family)